MSQIKQANPLGTRRCCDVESTSMTLNQFFTRSLQW